MDGSVKLGLQLSKGWMDGVVSASAFKLWLGLPPGSLKSDCHR